MADHEDLFAGEVDIKLVGDSTFTLYINGDIKYGLGKLAHRDNTSVMMVIFNDIDHGYFCSDGDPQMEPAGEASN